MDNKLILWDKAKQAIEEARTIDEVKDIRDKAEAFRLYAKQQKESLQVQNKVAEIKLRCERRIGEMLQETPKNEGGRPSQNKSQDATTLSPTLEEIGITKSDSSRWQKIAELPEDKFEEHIAEVQAANEELTTADMLSFAKGKPHVSNNSGENEWYTPSVYIEAARKTMGSIDTDPASSEIANKTVKALAYFTKDNSGIHKTWRGNVWLNPPYSQPLITQFSDIFVNKYLDKEFSQGIVLVNNATDTYWFQKLLRNCIAICFLQGRIKFLDTKGFPTGAPLQGQAILYFGANYKAFYDNFNKFGIILCQYEDELGIEN